MTNLRKIIIGDLHGCYDEAQKLLTLCEYNPKTDRLFFCGDLINRGPNSLGCYELYKKYNAICTLGNHEFELMMIQQGKWEKSLRSEKLKEEFGVEKYTLFLQDIQSWPTWIEEEEFILVHAGFPPDKKPEEYDGRTLSNIRYAKDPQNPTVSKPWFEYYRGKKPIVFGHWSLLGGIVRDNLYGIDLGCVYGKKLRAIIFPEKKILEVPAVRQYYNPLKLKNL